MAARLSSRVSLAAGRRSARCRRQAAMKWPGRTRAPINTRSGAPTAAATSSRITGAVSGNSTALESLETTFHQDLNGDGTIGLASTVIESVGLDQPVEVGNNYYLESISSGTGPELKYVARPSWRASLAAGRRSARSRRRPAMKWPGRCGRRSVHGLEYRQQRQLRLAISPAPCREAARRWNRWRPPSIRTSTATG